MTDISRLLEGIATLALVPRHVHHREDEVFYVLEGNLVMRVGEPIGVKLMAEEFGADYVSD